MYERILVPVDGSSTSDLGLAEAIKLARLTGGRLVLLHVVDTVGVAAIPGVAAPASRLFEAMRECGEEILAKTRLAVEDAGISAESVLLDTVSGRVSDLVVEEARKRRADLT
jgi:nucleotide-binding universal stress UspA family protein